MGSGYMPGFADGTGGDESGAEGAADLDLALVVGSSTVDRIVLARIAERSGLHVVALEPGRAMEILVARRPGTILLDGGADGRECDDLIPTLAAMRDGAGSGRPFVVYLSNRPSDPGRPPTDVFDSVVSRPITPDRLQPLIVASLERRRP